MTHKYKVRYLIEAGSYTKEELQKIPEPYGACDAIILHSIIMPSDGSRSEIIMTNDGEGQSLPDVEMYKSWVAMAHQLSQSVTLSSGQKELCSQVFNITRNAILKARNL